MAETTGSDQSTTTSPSRRGFRWTRARIVWGLLLLSLLPGIAASQFREHWEQQVRPVVRVAAYVLSGILIVVACALIIAAPDEPEAPPPREDG